MTPFYLITLGANSASPLPGRFPSSFVLNHNHNLCLIDCGEGCQIKLSEFGVKRSRINNIYISHLHGDHIFGLPGLLHSFNLNGRKTPIHITGPQGIKTFVDTVATTISASYNYEINFTELESDQIHELAPTEGLQVTAFPLKHRIPTFGYLFTESPLPLNINVDAIEKYRLTIEEIRLIKSGKEIIRGKNKIPASQLTAPKSRLRSFAYCSDTLYDPTLTKVLVNVDVLYHEATYTHDLMDKARERMHSTARQAAELAKSAEVSHLIIGHYSSRYRDLSVLLEEAQDVFPNTSIAYEGTRFDI